MSEVKLSKARSITGEIRWDSEYYQKKFIYNEFLLNKKNTHKFGDLCFFIRKGIFDLSPNNYIKEGIPFIRTSEIKNPTIDFSSTVYISDAMNDLNSKTALVPNDIVFTKIGAYIGDVSILPNFFSKYNFSQNVAGASIKNKKYSAYYLAFFLSDFGKNQILRSAMLSGQGKLELDDIRNYRIPEVTDKTNNQIHLLFEKRNTYIRDSQSLYHEAETLLLQELGLADFTPSNGNISIKTLAGSFLATGRLDAEYYQKKYEEIEKKIKNYKYGFSLVQKEFIFNKTQINRGDAQYNYIEIGDINIGNGSYCFNLLEEKELPDNAKIKAVRDDILISKVRPNRGAVSIIQEDIQNLVVSGAFTVIHESSEYKKETIFVLLRTPFYKDWLLKYNVGTSYPVIKDADILDLPVPLLPAEVQQRIAGLVQESFALRKQSEELLEEAKAAVEAEIEGGKYG